MNITRRSFLETIGAFGAASALAGCRPFCCGGAPKAKIALQLYSIRDYISKPEVGLERALEAVAKIGYKGVEFAGYYGFTPKQIKKMLDDNGLVACGTHVGRRAFSPEQIKSTCEFNLGFGNKFICCPGGGNRPPSGEIANNVMKESIRTGFLPELCEYYNRAAEEASKYGCLVGLHNHTWEFDLKFADGLTYWDYFFSNTDKRVQMEQDVGWTTCAGYDPCEQYRKYPGRSYTLHAKENGMGRGVKEFDAILGQPGKPGAVPVNWDALIPASEADGVKWYVVECERHCNDLTAVTPSYEFLKAKGLN